MLRSILFWGALLIATLCMAQDELPILRFRVVVGFTPTQSDVQKQVSGLGGVISVTRIFPRHADSTALGRWYEVRFSRPEHAKSCLMPLQAAKWIEVAEPVTAPQPTFIPNDMYYAQQATYFQNIGIQAAWDSCQGDSSVVIGVVDTGFDLDHPDIASNMAINYAEPINGLDDDNDGYIDNRVGIDLAGNNSANMAVDNNPTSPNSGGHSHGVHVAGIAAALGNNSIGVAGVAYKCRILPVKACADNVTSLFKAYEGMVYAADHGASIINCSFTQSDYTAMGNDATAYCIARGVIVVVACGNTSTVSPAYPANFPGTISVASSDINGTRSGFSTYNTFVSIMAPGAGLSSTEFNDVYGVRSGTSMASPVVAGAMALLKTYHKQETPNQLKARLLTTADTSVLTLPSNAGFAHQLGTGRLRIDKALFHKGSGFAVVDAKMTNLQGQTLSGSEDSLLITFTVQNFLAKAGPSAQMFVNNISPGFFNPNLRISLSSLPTNGRVTGSFKLNMPTPNADNVSIVIRFTFRDSGYTFRENRLFLANVTFQNWEAPYFKTTSTSNGRLGFINTITQGGLGILYRGNTLLYEGGLLLGTQGDTAFSTVRAATGIQANDFARIGRVRRIPTGQYWRTESFFSDANSPLSRGLKIHFKQGAGIALADSNFILCQATISNLGTRTVRQMYGGLFADWDVTAGGLQDFSGFIASLGTPFMRGQKAALGYYGIAPLSGQGRGAACLNNNGTSNQPNLNDFWTNTEKAAFLRSGNQYAGQMRFPSIGDVSILTSLGPFDIPRGDSTTIAFAIVFGQDSSTLHDRAIAAQRLYNVVTSIKGDRESRPTWSLYPNPASNHLTITTPKADVLTLRNSNGYTLRIWTLSSGTHTLSITDLPNGLYMLQGNQGSIQKWMLQR